MWTDSGADGTRTIADTSSDNWATVGVTRGGLAYQTDPRYFLIDFEELVAVGLGPRAAAGRLAAVTGRFCLSRRGGAEGGTTPPTYLPRRIVRWKSSLALEPTASVWPARARA